MQIALGFYEWHLDAAERKAPYCITVVDQPVFAFAAPGSDRELASIGRQSAKPGTRGRRNARQAHRGAPPIFGS
jgi:putative SOS response-associated peptidase YedK